MFVQGIQDGQSRCSTKLCVRVGHRRYKCIWVSVCCVRDMYDNIVCSAAGVDKEVKSDNVPAMFVIGCNEIKKKNVWTLETWIKRSKWYDGLVILSLLLWQIRTSRWLVRLLEVYKSAGQLLHIVTFPKAPRFTLISSTSGLINRDVFLLVVWWVQLIILLQTCPFFQSGLLYVT